MNMSPVFFGFKYCYFRDRDMEYYILTDKKCEILTCLEGDGAYFFQKEIAKIDNLPQQCNAKTLKDNLISLYCK